jgi:transposase
MGSEQKGSTRRQFSADFKAGAVGLVLEEGKTMSQVARDLGIHLSALSRWVEQARANKGQSTRGTTPTAEREELTRLRRENRELKLEREILKKAAAFFAKQNG